MANERKIMHILPTIEEDLLAYTTATRVLRTMNESGWNNATKVLQLVQRVEDVVQNGDDPRFCVEDILDALIYSDLGTNDIDVYLALSDAEFELTCTALAITSRHTYETGFTDAKNGKVLSNFMVNLREKHVLRKS